MSNENSNLRVGSAGAGLFVGDKQIISDGDNVIINNPALIIANNTNKSVKGTLSGDTYEEDIRVDLNPGQVKFIHVDTNVSGRILFDNNVDCYVSGMYYDDNDSYGSIRDERINESAIPLFNYYWDCCVVLVINNYYTT